MLKSAHSRYKCEAAITVRQLNDEKTFVAKMLNFSKAGMYFEADSFFKKGSIIYTRMTDGLVIHSDSKPDEKPDKARLAEVRWYKKIVKDNHSRYGVGVKYC
ncbi:PilZ domain-containing protein [Desulfococcaceae bacterium HSG7]|nr:PilZ domain-containing protein [Desulfococcaceae bacterium HSG9]MDM8554228.1 PilZ domain-containing protein [Desulfococcaceae bacterium HSG7]